MNDLDWPDLIKEIESVGHAELTAVQSLLVRALEHLLKQAAWPDAEAARKWRHEAGVFLRDARRAFTPSMAGRIDPDQLYADALETVRGLEFAEGPPAPLPASSRVTLHDLVAGPIEALPARFRASPHADIAGR